MSNRTRLIFIGLLFATSQPAMSQPGVGQKSESGKSPADVAEEQQVGRWLKQMDRDKNGKITLAESTGLMKRFFNRNDTDKDGVLDGGELAALSKRLRENARRNGNPQRNATTQELGAALVRRRVPENVVAGLDLAYRDGDSKAWRLDLFQPKEKSETPRPGIVFVHGGGWATGDKRAGTFLNGAIEYAAKGYVCITINYRLTDEAPFPACVEDVKCAVRWFRAHAKKYNLDPDRVGGYGNSAGAHLVSMLGLVGADAKLEGDGPWQDQSSLLQSVCASATPTDFLLNVDQARVNARSAHGKLLAGSVESIRERAVKASPITFVRKDAPPFLLFHGTSDRTVKVEHSDRFVEALKKAGAKDVTYIRIEGASHGVFNQHKDRTHPLMEKFFTRTLGQSRSQAGSKTGKLQPGRAQPGKAE